MIGLSSFQPGFPPSGEKKEGERQGATHQERSSTAHHVRRRPAMNESKLEVRGQLVGPFAQVRIQRPLIVHTDVVAGGGGRIESIEYASQHTSGTYEGQGGADLGTLARRWDLKAFVGDVLIVGIGRILRLDIVILEQTREPERRRREAVPIPRQSAQEERPNPPPPPPNQRKEKRGGGKILISLLRGSILPIQGVLTPEYLLARLTRQDRQGESRLTLM